METNQNDQNTNAAGKTLRTKEAVLALLELYDYHTKLFYNVIEGITDTDAVNRMDTKANHPSWITGSLVQQRYELAKLLGEDVTSTNNEIFKNFKGIQDDISYPALAEYRKDWETISPILKNAILKMDVEKLNSKAPYEMEMDMSFYDSVMFLVDRESYCIGQIALYRRLMGYEAMKYA